MNVDIAKEYFIGASNMQLFCQHTVLSLDTEWRLCVVLPDKNGPRKLLHSHISQT